MKMQTDKNTKIRGGKQGQRSTLYLIHTKDQTLSEKMPGGKFLLGDGGRE